MLNEIQDNQTIEIEHLDSSVYHSPFRKVQTTESQDETPKNQNKDARDKIINDLVEKRAQELLTEALSRSFKDLYPSERPNENAEFKSQS